MADPATNGKRTFGEALGIAAVSIGVWELGKYLLRSNQATTATTHAELPQEIDQEARLSGLRSRLEQLESDHSRYLGGR